MGKVVNLGIAPREFLTGDVPNLTRTFIVLLVSFASILFSRAQAATITARSVSFTDVASAVGLAKDGDLVVVPAGTAGWTSTLTLAKGIQLEGAGNNATVILDNIPRTTGGGAVPIISGKFTATQSFRLTGFTFRYGSVTTATDGSIVLSGTSQGIRVDHCHFDQLYTGHNVELFGCLYGVIDHCVFDIRNGIGGGTTATALVTHANWGNNVSGWGSWADPPYFGTEKFIFFEDNVINNLSPAPNGGSIDAAHGGRYVARYNTFNNSNLFYHGSDTGSGGAYIRGTRAVEIYNNTFHTNHPAHSAGQDRGGPLIWHDNNYTGTYTGGMALKVYRVFQGGVVKSGAWGAANGVSPWDCNVTEPDGTHVDGHAPYLFATGQHVGANDSKVVTVSGQPWKSNQWVGYSVTNTNSASPYFSGCDWIISNTANTLTLAPYNDPPYPKFNTGDTFAIHKVLIALDQPGRGKGDLLKGNPVGTTNLTGTPWPAWLHQALEPCYSWKNTLNGSNLNFSTSGQNTLRENIDYYNATPMPGYTPYKYPHPLTGPAPPSNLAIVSGP